MQLQVFVFSFILHHSQQRKDGKKHYRSREWGQGCRRTNGNVARAVVCLNSFYAHCSCSCSSGPRASWKIEDVLCVCIGACGQGVGVVAVAHPLWPYYQGLRIFVSLVPFVLIISASMKSVVKLLCKETNIHCNLIGSIYIQYRQQFQYFHSGQWLESLKGKWLSHKDQMFLQMR